MKKSRLLGAVCASAFLFISTSSKAAPVIDSFTGGVGPFSSFHAGSSGDVIGYSFIADVDLTVTDLGIINDPVDGALDSAHSVGLWDTTSETLLGSVSVDSGDSLIDGFYYATLAANINLTAGMEYVLGALYTTDDIDNYLSGPTSITTTNISSTVGVFPSDADLGFVFPTETTAGNLGRIGPNMLAAPTIPIPAALWLFGSGLLGLVGIARRKKA